MIIRWLCEKCSKKWIYPIEKCVYCKGPVIKQKGSKIKVAGITKVAIPSPMHPIIPYNVLLLEDEHGNRMPKKTMKDYKIGDVYVEQKAKGKDAVAVVKVKYDIYEAIKEAVELLNGIDLSNDDKILVKPSVTIAAYPYQAANTNPDFLNALILALLEHGIRKENIMVAEQALIGSDSMDAASKAGILEVCKKNGISFADISKGSFEEVESDGYKFRIFKEALGRKIINAPIMKTNFQLGLSGAMENLSRLCDESTQKRMYFDSIDETLPKLVNALNVFIIADATSGMQGQGPLTPGEPAFLNLVYAGRNPAMLDAVFCEASMLDIPPYIKLGKNMIKGIEIVGNELDALKYPIKKPVADETPHPDIKAIDGKACPACLNAMFNVTSRLVGLRGEQLNLAMGSVLSGEMLEGKERLVAYGDCAIKRLEDIGAKPMAKISENVDMVEQLVFLKKLLTSKGESTITPIDKVKSKMKKLLSRVVQ